MWAPLGSPPVCVHLHRSDTPLGGTTPFRNALTHGPRAAYSGTGAARGATHAWREGAGGGPRTPVVPNQGHHYLSPGCSVEYTQCCQMRLSFFMSELVTACRDHQQEILLPLSLKTRSRRDSRGPWKPFRDWGTGRAEGRPGSRPGQGPARQNWLCSKANFSGRIQWNQGGEASRAREPDSTSP